jgi:hypothetical protein
MDAPNELPLDLLSSAKWAFTTRRVRRAEVKRLAGDFRAASTGDLLLCEILEVGQHKKIQLADRRNSTSYPGDLVVVVLGDRYAPDQFMARAAVDSPHLSLAAGGGVAGRVEARHAFMEEPTRLRVHACLRADCGRAINVADYALDPLEAPEDVTVLCVVGASMNSGKTTAAAALAHGLSRAGHRVAGIKATGTGAFGDFNALADAGVPVSDFTDAGMATTFRMPLARIERGFETLVGHAARAGARTCVIELADGLFQQETRSLLHASVVRERMDGLMLAVPDALSAYGGVTALAESGLKPFALSGMVSCSPLASAEASEATGLPVLSREALCDPATVRGLVAPCLRPPVPGLVAAE